MLCFVSVFFFFKQKTAYEMRISDWSSDVCSSDLRVDLPCEYLRVFSPSAELRGHGLPEPMLLGGKREVNIVRIEPVGSYAVRLVFDDGHDSGLYSWDVFDELAREHDTNWQRYLQRLDDKHGRASCRERVCESV